MKPPFEWRTEDGKVKINNGFITVAKEMEVTGTGEGTLGLHGHVEDRSGCQVPSLVPPHSICCEARTVAGVSAVWVAGLLGRPPE